MCFGMCENTDRTGHNDIKLVKMKSVHCFIDS